MTALGQRRKLRLVTAACALPPKADWALAFMSTRPWNGCLPAPLNIGYGEPVTLTAASLSSSERLIRNGSSCSRVAHWLGACVLGSVISAAALIYWALTRHGTGFAGMDPGRSVA